MNFSVFFQLNTNKLNSLSNLCQLIYGGPNEGRRLSGQFVIFSEFCSVLVVCVGCMYQPKLTESGNIQRLFFSSSSITRPECLPPRPPVRRCPGPSLCSPPPPMAAVLLMNSTGRVGSTPGLVTSNRNSS